MLPSFDECAIVLPVAGVPPLMMMSGRDAMNARDTMNGRDTMIGHNARGPAIDVSPGSDCRGFAEDHLPPPKKFAHAAAGRG